MLHRGSAGFMHKRSDRVSGFSAMQACQPQISRCWGQKTKVHHQASIQPVINELSARGVSLYLKAITKRHPQSRLGSNKKSNTGWYHISDGSGDRDVDSLLIASLVKTKKALEVGATTPPAWVARDPNLSSSRLRQPQSPKVDLSDDLFFISITMKFTAPSQLSVRVSSPSPTALIAQPPRTGINCRQPQCQLQRMRSPIPSSA